jgi:hypothetical protein
MNGKFSALVHTGPEAQQASCTMDNGSLLGVKRGFDHTPSPRTEDKERVEMYIYLPLPLPRWAFVVYSMVKFIFALPLTSRILIDARFFFYKIKNNNIYA